MLYQKYLIWCGECWHILTNEESDAINLIVYSSSQKLYTHTHTHIVKTSGFHNGKCNEHGSNLQFDFICSPDHGSHGHTAKQRLLLVS